MPAFARLSLALLLLAPGALAREGNLLRNPGFEEGLAAWSLDHAWYVQGEHGLSEAGLETAVAHTGSASLRIVGADNRGIVMQIREIEPDDYLARGWLRCEGLEGVTATLLLEFKTREGAWISGIPVGSVTGTAEWTQVETRFRPPEGAVTVSIDLLTSAPNSGTVWFDDLELLDTTTDSQPPAAIDFTCETPEGMSGALRLDWSASPRPDDIARYRVYLSDQRIGSIVGLLPATDAPWYETGATLTGLPLGEPRWIAVVAVDLDSNCRNDISAKEVTAVDRKPPRSLVPELTPVVSATPALLARWSAPDADAASLSLLWRPPGGDSTVIAIEGHDALLAGLPGDAEIEVALVARDEAGNESEALWRTARTPSGGPGALAALDENGAPLEATYERLPHTREGLTWVFASAAGYETSAPVLVASDGAAYAFRLEPAGTAGLRLWSVSPLTQVFRDAVAPEGAAAIVDLLAMRNETESGQIVLRAEQPLAGVEASFLPFVREEGGATLPPSLGRANWVGYCHVERNSKLTPLDKLVRQAPADYPDELLTVGRIDLVAGQAQPLFLRVDVPGDAEPGVYLGGVVVSSECSSWRVPIRLEVLPLSFPDRTRLLVTNWFSTAAIAEKHGVREWSEEFWAILPTYARMMAEHHQNVEMAPTSLIEAWQEDDGGFTWDFSRFDRWVELFDAAGVDARIELSHLGGRKTGEWECPEFVFGERTATRRSDGSRVPVEVPDFVRALAAHLRERGWLERSMLHIADEPIPVNEESWRALSRIAQEAAPDLRRIDAIHVTDLDGDLEVWVPQLNFFDQAHQSLREKANAGTCELWFYIAWVPQYPYPNRLIDVPTLNARIAHWMNYLYGTTGYLHWGLNWWNIELGHFSPGDEWIIWPGDDGPHSSLRYEAQREGLEDCECLALLEDALRANGDPEPARLSREIGGKLVSAITRYESDPARLEEVRRELLRALVANQ